MSAAQRLAEALHLPGVLGVHSGEHDRTCDHCVEKVSRLTFADPELEAAIDLGLAWAAAEAALPDMPPYVKPRTKWSLRVEHYGDYWDAEAFQDVDDDWQSVSGTGSTAAEALRALTEKLASQTGDQT